MTQSRKLPTDSFSLREPNNWPYFSRNITCDFPATRNCSFNDLKRTQKAAQSLPKVGSFLKYETEWGRMNCTSFSLQGSSASEQSQHIHVCHPLGQVLRSLLLVRQSPLNPLLVPVNPDTVGHIILMLLD